MVTYDNEFLYIESQQGILNQIKAIDNIISALLITAAKAATNAHITEYSLNTGQTQIKTSLRGVQAITDSIQAWRKLKNSLKYQLKGNGRVTMLVDGKNLIGPRNIR